MKLLAIDGNSVINRAFYGIRLLSNKDGMFTNGIYGFMNILFKLKDETKPDAVAVAFDLPAPTFRHLKYAEYKAGRKLMPDELGVQIPVLKDILRLMGYHVVEAQGFEADDILGTLAESAQKSEHDCVIATGDRDSLQLVGDGVTVMLAATKAGRPEVTIYDEAKIKSDYGVTPIQMIEIKALQGDSSDNIPGVAGVGPKTAGDLICKYQTVQYIYDNIESIDIKDTLRQRLINDKEKAFLSHNLATICRSVPIETDYKKYLPNEMDKPALKALLSKLEMFKIIERLDLNAVQAIDIYDDTEKEIETESAEVIIDDFGVNLDSAIWFYDFDKSVLAAKLNEKHYIFTKDFEKALKAKNIATYNCKRIYTALNISYCPDISFDCMLAGYLLNPDQNDYSIDRLCAINGIAKQSFSGEYADTLSQLECLAKLTEKLKTEIKNNEQTELLTKIEIPLSYTLYLMEREGFLVDKNGIKDYGEQLSKRMEELETQIFDIIGYTFNLNSPKQLGEALFEKLKLPHGKKTKTGYSTSAQVLESLKYESDAVELLLEYRSVTKLKSTYCDGLLKVIGDDGRIHSTLKQTETRTGRISSIEPNLQNIPVRTPLGRELRKFFIARENWVLLDADYSQIELRVLADIANDTKMIEAFLSDVDIHTKTASQVFNLPIEMVTPDVRSRAKAVNFGIVYGIGAFSLSKDINVSVAEAKRYIESYYSTYSGVDEYMKSIVETAKEKGYVTTLFNRRRYLPELSSSNFNLRSFGERVARNMPIQGTAADIIKIAMVRVGQRLERENLKARLIMQVHDELICEAPIEEKDKVADILQQEMESAVNLKVPMVAEVNIGKSWFDAK